MTSQKPTSASDSDAARFEPPDPRLIDQAMLADRFRLRKAILRWKKTRQPAEAEKIRQRLQNSIERAESRRAAVPPIEFDDQLPVNQRRDEIRDLIRQNRVVIVCGETGSGKSTQLPKICLEAGLGVWGTIGHTQPRRIAARSVAARIAEELKCELGQQVGYQVRFHDQTSATTLIKLMTDGILLAETQTDRFLEQYDCLIIDEAHERSLNIDFLLGFLKTLLPKRPDFRLIITSATIDAARFSEHFSLDGQPAPVIEVSGRSYPVEVRYRPLADPAAEPDRDYFDGINDAVVELLSEEPGDVLVFLPTEKDIRTAARKLRGLEFLRKRVATEVLPLYARLSVAEQNRIFHPDRAQRIVLATNVAESSLTVPRIKYVIDAGLARISRYSSRSKIQRLPIEPVSQASANQRAGRCGRLGPGVCIRLYSEEDFASRDAFTTPEIRRTNLASVILQAKSMHFGDVDRIDFLDPPRPEAIRDGYKTLFEIGATDGNRRLTDLGHRLKNFPSDPRISRMILAGDQEGVLAEVLIIAAALEVQDVRDRPVEKQKQADQAHAQFTDPDSDFQTLLNIWDFYHQQKSKLSNNQLRKSLQQNFLSLVRIREWLDVYRQLKDICRQEKIKIGPRTGRYDNIHRALLAGMLSGVATKGDKFEYEGAGGNKFFIWPGSGLIEQSPKWILGTEIVETSKRYIRNLAKIQPAWIEPLAKHLVSRTQSDPFWHEKSEKVMANEKVTLFGLTIIPRRMVPFANHDPQVARQIFLEEALVNERLPNKHPFQQANAQTMQLAREKLAKTRNRELVIDDARIHAFYDQRIPQDVFDGVSLQQWLRKDRRHDQQLQFQLDDLITDKSIRSGDFPDQIATTTIEIPLEYAFEPGSDRDGITTRVPAAAIAQLNEMRLQWLVPGMLAEKIEALIRSLPKSQRRWFAPVPDTAARLATELEFAQGDLLEKLAAVLTRIASESVSASDFDLDKLPYHLKMNIEVTDDQGKVIDSGRDLLKLQEKHCSPDEVPQLAHTSPIWNASGLKSWSFESIPPEIPVSHGGMTIKGFPAIVDEGDSVALKVLPTAQLAAYETGLGIMRLAAINKSAAIRKQLKWIPGIQQHLVIASQFSPSDQVRQDLLELIARRAFVDLPDRLPQSAAEFQATLDRSTEWISIATQDVAALLPRFFEHYQAMKLAKADASADWAQPSIAAINEQLSELLYSRFWVLTPWDWLNRYPVYFQAIIKRLEKLNRGTIDEDAELEQGFRRHYQHFLDIRQRQRAQGIFDPELIHYRFMIEEFRVSIFAQQLGTAVPVSEKRLEKQQAKLYC